jgi:aminomethyltransferase
VGGVEKVRETPLSAWHRGHGARMTEFAGYAMPLYYTGIVQEHRAVRTRVGIFDVSHMAEFDVRGPAAAALLDRLATNWVGRLGVGQALYSPLCAEDGGTVDDVVILKTGPDRFLVVGNAANHESDRAWLLTWAAGHAGVRVYDQSDDTALLAVQGPAAAALLRRHSRPDVTVLKPFSAATDVRVAGRPVFLVSRTGYTGEDGFEIFLSGSEAEAVWSALVADGAVPAGLGARDTLRLEARLPLYGHELSRAISPLEAGLDPFVQWNKPIAFVGYQALASLRHTGPKRRLVGLRVEGGIARQGAAVGHGDGDDGEGVVTSGTFSPTLQCAIALALVPSPWAATGTRLWVEVRGRRLLAEVVRTPFYRRQKGQ